MSVKVIIVRHVPEGTSEDLTPLLHELRIHALNHTGYISGETLIRVDDPREHLVISTWDSLESWNQWLNNPERGNIQAKVDDLIGSETLFQVYFQS